MYHAPPRLGKLLWFWKLQKGVTWSESWHDPLLSELTMSAKLK